MVRSWPVAQVAQGAAAGRGEDGARPEDCGAGKGAPDAQVGDDQSSEHGAGRVAGLDEREVDAEDVPLLSSREPIGE